MKKIYSLFMILLLSLTSLHAAAQTTPAALTKKQVNEWYEKKEWLAGMPLQPHKSINKTVFARQYQLNKNYWNKAFAFLKEHDLTTMAAGRYAIDSNNVFAIIT